MCDHIDAGFFSGLMLEHIISVTPKQQEEKENLAAVFVHVAFLKTSQLLPVTITHKGQQ